MRNIRVLSLGLALAGAMLVAACTGTDQKTNDLLAQVAITHATQKVIEAGDNTAERAVKLHDIAQETRSLLDGSTVTLPNLEAAVRDKLKDQNLSPADLLLVDSLLRAIAIDLARRVGSDHLNEDQRIAVRQVIDIVIASASLYLPKNPDPGEPATPTN